MLKVANISKTYQSGSVNATELFEDFSFTIATGEFISVIGSNGSGKTSLLNVIYGNLKPDAGDVFLQGEKITALKAYQRSKKIGRVFQDPAKGTCPSMNILENLSMADNKGQFFGLGRGVNKKRIDYYQSELKKLKMGLEDKLYVKVGALSGGQRQALALLLSTMTPLDLLVLDEHTAALDPKASEIVMELTDEIVKEKNITTLMVTHNMKYALHYGNRLIMMHDGHVVLDVQDQQKEAMDISQLLDMFNKISLSITT